MDTPESIIANNPKRKKGTGTKLTKHLKMVRVGRRRCDEKV
jgi:hypothetical protein